MNLTQSPMSSAAWLLLAVGENRAFGSNDGYKDEPELAKALTRWRLSY